jgi:hypothetical protein
VPRGNVPLLVSVRRSDIIEPRRLVFLGRSNPSGMDIDVGDEVAVDDTSSSSGIVCMLLAPASQLLMIRGIRQLLKLTISVVAAAGKRYHSSQK